MAGLTSVEERRRKSRNILFAAFIVLAILWTGKLTFPQHTVATVYTDHLAPSRPPSQPSNSAARPSPTAPAKGQPTPKLGDSIAIITGDEGLLNSSKAAVIIETRFRTNLIPLILHFSSVLGPSWPILIYTSAESVGLFAASAALTRYLHSGQIQVRILPQTVLFTNSDSVNAFMTKKWLWESLEPAENILLFQSDSMLCANAARSVDDYFEYDFVGAPIATGLGVGYNGGLSLRKRSTIMEILNRWDWETTKKEGDRFEDQWFYNRSVLTHSASAPSFTPIPSKFSLRRDSRANAV